jgi:hypothetical protein
MSKPDLDDIVDRMTYRELLTMVKNGHEKVQVAYFRHGTEVGIQWTRAVQMPRAAFDLLLAERNLMG